MYVFDRKITFPYLNFPANRILSIRLFHAIGRILIASRKSTKLALHI